MSAAADFLTASRRARDAATRLKRAVATLRLRAEDTTGAARQVIGYEAETLLWTVLFTIDELVPVLNEEAELDDLERLARDLRDVLRRRRLAGALAETEGRTIEEAALFAAKAAELDGR